MDEYKPVHIPTSERDARIIETGSDREMCNIYGYINPNVFDHNYKYFYVSVQAKLDEFDTDNETLVPILAVLKKQADARFEINGGNVLCATIVFSYSYTGVTNMQKVMTECENTIKKFNKNIYSINTNIIIRERTSDTSDDIKQFYRYYIANNIFNRREILFKRYSTKKYLKWPDEYNFYWLDPLTWKYRVYKWPIIVYENGHTELDTSQSYDQTREITIGNKTYPAVEKPTKPLIKYSDGNCSFGEEIPVELNDYESYDQWSNPIRKTTQRVYISAPGHYYFETPYTKENTYRYSYSYDTVRIESSEST